MTEEQVRSRFDRFLRWTIEVEYPAHERFLPAGEREPFGDYYQALPRPGEEAAIRRKLRGMWRGDVGWTARWLGARPEPVVMDAGSGFGTFAMLYAACGARVIAADLRPDRLSAADKRLAFYRESTGTALDVSNRRIDLTGAWPEKVDLVWVYNAISHVDPLEPFVRQVREHLKPGGVLVVGDINGGNPIHQERLSHLRDEVHQEYVAPDGQRHTYAVERTFTPAQLREALEGGGMRIVHHELYWGGLASLPEPVYAGIVRPLQSQWRLGTRQARRQMVVAAA